LARKPSTKSSSSSSRKKVHPKRTGIVWAVFGEAMTLACGVLLMSDRWVSLEATSVQTELQVGRWEGILIHHSGTHAASVADLARRQSDEWGLNSIGYHIVIGNGNGEHDGDVIRCPRWVSQRDGAHFASTANGLQPDPEWINGKFIRICLIGNGDERDFTDAQYNALLGVVHDLQRRCGIKKELVMRYADLMPTTSPGARFEWQKFHSLLY